MNRIIKSLLFLLLFLLPLTACGNTNKSNDTPQQIVFDEPWYDWEATPQEPLVLWVTDDVERIYMQRALARYQELTGSKLEISQFSWTDYNDALRKSILGEIEKPDVLMSYSGTNVELLNPDENFYDFSDAPWVKDLTATSINQTIYNGKVIGLPHTESSISGMLYNKTIFNELNIQIPENQAEFLAVCQALKENGITPVYLPYKEISMLLYQFPMDAILEDPDILAGLNDGTLSYSDIPEMKTIVEWYRTMSDLGYLGENYLENDWTGMNDAMDSGKYAILPCWDTWLYTDFTGDPSNFGIMPAFMGVPEHGTFEGPNQILFIVNRNSPRLDSALNFITFLADPYNYNVAFDGLYTAPAFKNQTSCISTPQYAEAERLIEEHFRDSTAWLRVRGFSQMDATCIQKYMTAQPGYTVEKCLQEMDSLRQERIAFTDSLKGAEK